MCGPEEEREERDSKTSKRGERKDRAKTKTFVATLGWPGRHRDHDSFVVSVSEKSDSEIFILTVQ